MSPEAENGDGLPPDIVEQQRTGESILEEGLDSRLSYPFAIEFQGALLRELKPGDEFTNNPAVVVAMMKDASPTATFERRERPIPTYTTQPIASVCDKVQATLDQLFSEVRRAEPGQGPASIMKLESDEAEVRKLAVEVEQLRTKLKARGRNALPNEQIEQNTTRLATAEKELRRKAQSANRTREQLSLAAESLETLTAHNQEERGAILKRLERKSEQMGEIARAATGLGRMGEFFSNYMKMMGDNEALMKMFTEYWIEKLSSDDLAPLASLPGLGEGLDVAFKTLLALDTGKGLTDPNFLPGFPRNLCATDKVTRRTRKAFELALIGKVETALSRDPKLATNARPLARTSAYLAMALHEIFFMSAYYSQPRDPSTGRQILPTDEHGQPIKIETTGSLYLGGPDTAGKVYGIREKLTKDLESGYPSPMAIAFRDIPDDMFFDLLQGITFTDPETGQEMNASEALLNGSRSLGQVFENMSLTAHSAVLYQMFSAQKIFGMLSQIPREQFALLPGRLDAAFKACREYSLWVSGFRKALEKGYAKTISDESERVVEVNRILANLTIAFLRKAISPSVMSGGDRANKEAGITDEKSNDVIRYLRERLAHEANSMTYELITFIGAIIVDEPNFMGITKEDLETEPDLRRLLESSTTTTTEAAVLRIARKRDLDEKNRKRKIKAALRKEI